MPLKVGLCATESSGDILGSDLIRNLKSKDPLIEFFGLGGSEMRKVGFNSFDSNEELQVMGLIDPIFRINRILKKRNKRTLVELVRNQFNSQAFLWISKHPFGLPQRAGTAPHSGRGEGMQRTRASIARPKEKIH